MMSLRSPDLVMDIKRLGSLHQSRLSFMRVLMRKMMQENWQIEPEQINLDDKGYGSVVYSIKANGNRYSFVAFSEYLADEDRNDRVIAEKWDVTMALVIGTISEDELLNMKRNVPKQEAGRANSNMMVLSRGNKSSRNFDYVVTELSQGRQPSMDQLVKVGYLYRTTAVYGSGKFGMADWVKVKEHCPEFASPFAAEMFACFMLRHFSIEQAEHLARIKNPKVMRPMADNIKRYIGIGNSTGLGMAPYLIRHPKLISQWVKTKEQTVARILDQAVMNEQSVQRAGMVVSKALQHFKETFVPDPFQIDRNATLVHELQEVFDELISAQSDIETFLKNNSWRTYIGQMEKYSFETQELFNSIMMECYPDMVDGYEEYPCVDESYSVIPDMKLNELKQLIEHHYDWALAVDFSKKSTNHYFWYRSEEKMEPRIGERFSEPGQEKEMPLLIARLVRECYDSILDTISESDVSSVAQFLLDKPEMASITKRIQSMSQEDYGEIRGNLSDVDMLPLDLLRCKLSFFGVSKFDPKSKLWVRNTMFQGAPILSDIGKEFKDDWYFPITTDTPIH